VRRLDRRGARGSADRRERGARAREADRRGCERPDDTRSRRDPRRAWDPRRAGHSRERGWCHGVVLRVGAGPRPPLLGPRRDPPEARGEDARRVRSRVGRVGREADHLAAVGDGRGDPRGRRCARDARQSTHERADGARCDGAGADDAVGRRECAGGGARVRRERGRPCALRRRGRRQARRRADAEDARARGRRRGPASGGRAPARDRGAAALHARCVDVARGGLPSARRERPRARARRRERPPRRRHLARGRAAPARRGRAAELDPDPGSLVL